MIAVGLMSGTSLDGIDAALVDIRPKPSGYEFEMLEFQTTRYAGGVQRALLAVMPPKTCSVEQIAHVHRTLGEAFADAAACVTAKHEIDFAAMHGQTVFHDGERAITLQLGSPFFLRDRLQTTVCFDFRSADCALGGHGAPLIPYVDSMLLSSPAEDRVAVNIGGIANVTFLPRAGSAAEVVAFDTGPGNMLIDAFVQERTAGGRRFDEGGALAAAGTVHRRTLDRMLADPYFALDPPKSTGRERFGSHFLGAHETDVQALRLEDGAATLTELTATTIADSIRRIAAPGTTVLVSGGGAHNRALMDALARCLLAFRVETMNEMPLQSDAKEAIAFAIMGYQTLRGLPANLPRVTGASGPAVLGAVVPHNLARLLARVEAECAV